MPPQPKILYSLGTIVGRGPAAKFEILLFAPKTDFASGRLYLSPFKTPPSASI